MGWNGKILARLEKLQLSRENVIAISLFIVVFLVLAFLRRIPFQSDESIYAYSAYALSRGCVPYSGIQLAQPPLIYLALAFFINLVGPNQLFLKLAESFFVLLTGILIFVVAKRSRVFSSHGVFPVLCIVIYGFIAFDNFSTSVLEIFLTFFIMLCTVVYMLFILNKEKRNIPAIFLIGLLLGFCLMIKYTSLVFVASLFFYHCARMLWKKDYRRFFVDGIILFLGVAVPVAISMVLVTFVWGSFRQFYLQTIYWQAVRWPTSLNMRFFNIELYALKFFPLLILTGIGAFLVYSRAKNFQGLFFPIIFVLNLIGLTSVFTTFLLHYIYYLSPFLALLSAYGLAGVVDYVRGSSWNLKISKKNLAKWLLFITVLAMVIEVGEQVYLAGAFNEDSTHLEVGQYVSQITQPEDKIWTSEGAIAFFADRQVVAANSSDWPIQCSYADIFAYDFGTYMGSSMRDYKNGVILPQQFAESWETYKIKVIVIVRGTDWVPYPDAILWSGFQNFTGVSGYVQEKYMLNQSFISTNGSRAFEVWVRK